LKGCEVIFGIISKEYINSLRDHGILDSSKIRSSNLERMLASSSDAINRMDSYS
jgi:hypothetical protein